MLNIIACLIAVPLLFFALLDATDSAARRKAKQEKRDRGIRRYK